MEQVYLGGIELRRGIQAASCVGPQRFPEQLGHFGRRSFAIITGLGQITVIAFQLAECKGKGVKSKARVYSLQ